MLLFFCVEHSQSLPLRGRFVFGCCQTSLLPGAHKHPFVGSNTEHRAPVQIQAFAWPPLGRFLGKAARTDGLSSGLQGNSGDR